MLAADNAETCGLDRLGVTLHRRQQRGDAGLIDPLDAEEVS